MLPYRKTIKHKTVKREKDFDNTENVIKRNYKSRIKTSSEYEKMINEEWNDYENEKLK